MSATTALTSKRIHEALGELLERRDPNARGTVLGAGNDDLDSGRRFLSVLADGGWIVPIWPTRHGGRDADDAEASRIAAALADYEVADLYPYGVGLNLVGPILLSCGSPEQQDRWLRPIADGSEVWCQMFSEPGAGSDVASLSTRAFRDGDEWILTGQKVWTSGAHYCDFGLVVARTDPALPKHQGLSMFIVDLHAPGVDIRPLVQISGARGFNEVFFDSVRVPADDLLGEVNQGWNLAVSMLMFERVSIGTGSGALNAKRHPDLIRLARNLGRDSDPTVRQALANLAIGEEIKEYVSQRIRAEAAAGRVPGPEGSIAKLAGALLVRRTRDAAMAILGPSGQAWDLDAPGADEAAKWSNFCISAAGVSIAGGTDEVQRNIIGERVLGLPGDVRTDKDMAWKDVPRN
ncbi:MAG TPA: dehydrogenase [Acidimicrobiaceae bacterium]|nr:dehydrogenase [Acidimicrobiaceae bacterium]